MITFKKNYLIGLFLLLNFSLFSQILGGRSNGEMSPKVAQPSTLSGGTFSGDVNNMTGAYQASIPLGSVATPGGLSFGLSLEHTSSFGFSTNQPTSSGIPYGDGWNLSLPSISVETDIFNAYINSCSNSGACNVAGIDNNDAVNSLNPDRIWDGDLFWFSPTVNIPGVGGGQAVFKYIDNSDGGCAVFVLNKFETPIEIRFYGMNWEAHLADGTVYSFSKSIKTYRAPSNKRKFYYDCTTPSETFDMDAAHSALVEEPADFLFGEAIRDEIEPKEDFGTWYCDRIYNRNIPMQNIIFTYETFGEFNYFKEFLQPNYSLVHRDVFDDRTFAYLPDFKGSSDVYLVKVESWVTDHTPVDILELDYKTLTGSFNSSGVILNPDGPGVERLDSLYSYKVVASHTSGASFNSWYRYKHKNAGGLNPSISSTNPYLASGNTYTTELNTSSSDVIFDHSFLESPRINLGGIGAGDIFEIRTKIVSGTQNIMNGNGTIDIAVVTSKERSDTSVSFTPPSSFTATSYEDTRGTEIFSTFNMGMKWTKAATQALYTSNYFVMPNLPNDLQGFNVQIGPGNSEIDYSFQGVDGNNLHSFTDPAVLSGIEPNALTSYPQLYGSGSINSSGTIAHNFGIGLPWGMMAPVFNTMALASSNPLPNFEKLYLGIGTLDPDPTMFPTGYVNPTKFNDEVQLTEFELIRYSKNAYMLQGVRQYKINGTTGDYIEDGKKLVAQKKIDYTFIDATAGTLKNLHYQHGDLLEFNSQGRVIFLLSKVHDVPVEGSLYATNFGLAQPEMVLTTAIEYTNVLPALDANSATNYSNARPYQGLRHYAITKFTDHLGGVTTIQYYNVNAFPTRIVANISSVNSCPGFTYEPVYGAGTSFTMHLAVKYVFKNAENHTLVGTLIQPERKWEYVYDSEKQIYNRPTSEIPGNNFRGQFMYRYDLAFGKVTVFSPALALGERNYTVYEYHGKIMSPFVFGVFATEEEHVLYGKLKSVKTYDFNNILHEETIYNYDFTLAAKDGFYRPNFYKTGIEYYDHPLLRDFEYEDYYKNQIFSCDNPLYVTNNSLPPTLFGEEAKMALTPPVFSYRERRYLPFFLHNKLRSSFYSIANSNGTTTVAGNPEYLFNSYFVKKTSEIHRVYENGLSKSSTIPHPVFPVSSSVSSNFSGPVILNPVVFDSNSDPALITAIHTDFDDAIPDLITAGLLSDTVLIHLITELSILPINKLDVLLAQEKLSTKAWKSIIANYRSFPPTVISELVAMQPYFEDELQEYLITVVTAAGSGGSRYPFPEEFFTQVMLKNSLLSDNVIQKMAHITTAFPGQSFATILAAQDRQFSEQLLDSVIHSHQFSPNNALKVLTYQEFSDPQFMDLIDVVHVDDETFVEIFEKVNFVPSESVIEHFFDTYLPSSDLMQRVIDRVDWEMDSVLVQKIKEYYVRIRLPVDFATTYNPLSKFCSNSTSTARTFIETKKEFQYYEADYLGRAIGKPFEVLMGMISSIDAPSVFPKNLQYNSSGISVNRTVGSLQLKHEPSWQLFSVTTNSPHLPGAYSREEYFYLYDLQNRYDRIWHNYDLDLADILIHDPYDDDLLKDTLAYIYSWDDDFNYTGDVPTTPHFDGMARARSHNLKTLAFQKTSVTKNNTDAKPLQVSEYYHYDARWNFDDLFSGVHNVVYFDGEPCPTPPVDPCEECEYYNHVFNHGDLLTILDQYEDFCAWEIGYDLESYPYDYWFCPSDINPNNCDTLFNYLNVQCDETVNPGFPDGYQGLPLLSKLLSRTLQLRSVTVQVDTIDISAPNEFDAYKMDTQNKYIAEFKLTDPFDPVPNGFQGNYSMVLPFTNLTVRTIDERNRHFQPELEHNQVDLKTKYYYSKAQKTQHANDDCPSDQYQTITNTNIGLPVRITVGFERSDSLSTAYEYSDAGMITKVIEPSGKYSEYVFDGFQRLTQTSQNGERILADYTYHYWEKNPALNFQQRTQENYVYSKLYNSAQAGDLEMRRAYMDPLGRAQSVITSYEYAPSNVAHIYSGSTVYDNWDRALRTYKNYVVTEDFGTAPAAYYPPPTFNFQLAYSDSYYENTPKNRAYRVSNFGVNIAAPQNHVVRTTYAIANNVYTSCELNLNASELLALMGPGNTSAVRFYRTSVLDQDNKQSVEYMNAFGQKVATLKYNDANEKIITLFVYDSYGNLAKVINPKKQNSTYFYNSLGQLVKETTVDAGERKYMYNKQGLVSVTLDQQGWNHKDETEEKDPFYRVYSYDIYGRILSVGRSKGPTAYEGYATYGPLHYQTDLVNEEEVFDYDEFNQPLDWNYLNYTFTNSSSQDWLASYGVVTRIPQESSYNALITVQNNLENAFGQVILEKQTSYGNNTNLLAIGKIIEAKSYNNVGASVQKVNYQYNTYDQLAEQVIRMNPDQQVGVAETWAITSKISYPKYNYRGALLEETVDSDNNGVVDLHYFNAYDALNRLTAVYVASAAVLSKEDATLLVSYEHDDANGLVLEKTHSVTYDNAHTPFTTTSYEYDVRDRLTNVAVRNEWDNTVSPLFDYQLYYDAQTPYYNFGQTAALVHHHNWNGNINGSMSTYGHDYAVAVPSNMQEPLLYGYTYDKINRLVRADAMVGDVINGETGNQTYNSYTVGDENYAYDKIGNITVLNRHLLSTLPNEVMELEGFIYQYQTSTNKLLGVLGALSTLTENRTYTYDENANLLTDSYREIASTKYGRAAYAYNIVQDDKEINYLYSIDDQRMFKEIITSTETKREYYLSDAMGKVVALRTEIIPTGQPTSATWEYYAHGAEREARLVNTDNNPKFEADEVTFFVYDHLGNTRMSYTPQIALVPAIDEEVFNHNFGALLYDWQALDANTNVYLGLGALYAENLTGAAVAVNPGVSFEAGHTYTLTIAATEVNVSSITVEVNNVTIGTIQNSGLTDVFTFVAPSTGLFDIRIIGNGSSGTREFYVKNIKLEDQTPEHVAYSYVINHAADYFPYGKILREYVGTEKERYLTTQHERDEETGLDYRGARYYDSDIARFLSLDPHASDYSSWSAYNYVFGNPVHYIDMDGKDGVPFSLAFSRGLNDAFMASTVQFGFGRELAADAYPDDLEAQRAFLIGQLVADVAVMTAGGATMNTGAGILGTAATIEIGSGGTATVGALGMSIAGGITIAVGTNMVIQAGVGAESSILQLSAVNRKIDAQKNASSSGGKDGSGNSTNSSSSKEAFNKAKRQNDVPTSRQPTKQYKTKDKNTGNDLRTYDYKNSKGESVTIRKDAPVKYKDGGSQGPHHNAGKTGGKLKQHHNY